jgi:ArsR family transcriptional regulator
MQNGMPVSTTADSMSAVAGVVPESDAGRSAAVECAPHCSVPLTTARLSHDQAAQLSSVFKAMAHPTRVQLMNLLVGSPFAVCAYDLQVAMGMPQSTISHHLKLLVGSGLVHRQQRGIWAYYSINVEAMRALSLVTSLDDAPQQFSPAALRDPAVPPGTATGNGLS